MHRVTNQERVSKDALDQRGREPRCERLAVCWCGVLTLLLVFSATGCARQTHASDLSGKQKPIAEIGGKPVYERDISSQIQGRLLQLKRQEYEIRKQALDLYINQELLKQQALLEKLTPEKLLARDADKKVQPPTAAQVEAYYRAQPSLSSQPFAKVEQQARATLLRDRIQNARTEYLAALRKKAGVSIYLREPKVEVGYDPHRLRGNPHAPVMIVEFSDFQCPFCRGVEPTLRGILAEYPGKVSLAYRDLPLSQIHPLAEQAAEAARCAEEQGRFWQYHDLLMSNPPHLDRDWLIRDARRLHLNEPQFDACLSSGKYAAAVQRDRHTAMNLGIAGTPAFFINGTLVTGDQPASVFKKIIRKDLADLR